MSPKFDTTSERVSDDDDVNELVSDVTDDVRSEIWAEPETSLNVPVRSPVAKSKTLPPEVEDVPDAEKSVKLLVRSSKKLSDEDPKLVELDVEFTALTFTVMSILAETSSVLSAPA